MQIRVEESLLILGWGRELAAAAVELRPYGEHESQGTERIRKGQ